MINLCYGMKTINITQLPQGSYSHPNGAVDLAGEDEGVDVWRSMGRWKCIAGAWGANTYFFTAVDDEGKPTYVYCANGEKRIVTIALTHTLYKYVHPKVGKIYENGQPMYSEGTASANPNYKVTGNHIHLEIAGGLQYSKYYDKEMGVYRMQNELDPIKLFYCLDGYSTIKDDYGATIPHCSSIEHMEITDMIKEGFQRLSWNEQTILVYKQKADERLVGIAQEYGKTADIEEFNLPNKTVRAIVNCSYFNFNQGSSAYGDYYGRFQGYLSGSGAKVNNTTDRPEYGDKPYMDLVVLKEGTVKAGDFASWEYTDVMLGVSPAGVEILNGLDVNKYSPECGYSKITTANTQTFLAKDTDGRFILGVVTGQLAPIPNLRGWARQYGLTELSIYDSGGSTQMLVDGQKMHYTGRKIPTCMAFVSSDGDSTIDDGNDAESAEKVLAEACRERDAYKKLLESIRKQIDEVINA